jgi:hypothetical protein
MTREEYRQWITNSLRDGDYYGAAIAIDDLVDSRIAEAGKAGSAGDRHCGGHDCPYCNPQPRSEVMPDAAKADPEPDATPLSRVTAGEKTPEEVAEIAVDRWWANKINNKELLVAFVADAIRADRLAAGRDTRPAEVNTELSLFLQFPCEVEERNANGGSVYVYTSNERGTRIDGDPAIRIYDNISYEDCNSWVSELAEQGHLVYVGPPRAAGRGDGDVRISVELAKRLHDYALHTPGPLKESWHPDMKQFEAAIAANAKARAT